MVWLYGGGYTAGSPSLVLYDGKVTDGSQTYTLLHCSYFFSRIYVVILM